MAKDKATPKDETPEQGATGQAGANEPKTQDAVTKVDDAPKDDAPKAKPVKAQPEKDPYEAAIEEVLAMLTPAERESSGARLFVEACIAYGLNPDPATRPVEILPGERGARWRFLQGSDLDQVPDRVRFVTAGGIKIAHPMDAETEERLQVVFGVRGIDPRTGNSISNPLPGDLTLPRQGATGMPPRQPERPRLGFLKEQAQASARRGVR